MPFVEGGLAYVRHIVGADVPVGPPGRARLVGLAQNIGAVLRLVKSLSSTHYFAIDCFGNKFCVDTSHRRVTMRRLIGVEYDSKPIWNKWQQGDIWRRYRTLAGNYDIRTVEALSRTIQSHVLLMGDESDRRAASGPEFPTWKTGNFAPGSRAWLTEGATPSPSSPACSSLPTPTVLGAVAVAQNAAAKPKKATKTTGKTVIVKRKPASKLVKKKPASRAAKKNPETETIKQFKRAFGMRRREGRDLMGCKSDDDLTAEQLELLSRFGLAEEEYTRVVKNIPATIKKRPATIKKRPATLKKTAVGVAEFAKPRSALLDHFGVQSVHELTSEQLQSQAFQSVGMSPRRFEEAFDNRPRPAAAFRRPAAAAASIRDQVRYPTKRRIDWARKERDLQAILDRFGVQSKHELTPEQMEILVDEACYADECEPDCIGSVTSSFDEAQYPLSDSDSDSAVSIER